ncbi:hypothetical protein CEQ30_37530 [Nocardia brasiliensis]|uniref:Uncharacterized protein n=1 Tax=Nocardia vulneris TaxID=1141657 RepID=A0ABR4ZEW0_9NOCA|nr:hypothetical protein CEQ30_37530 [Nocardia brasiliensis]KIA63806.1 hypothetical protein FG87_17040 [Nocardia vulneris]
MDIRGSAASSTEVRTGESASGTASLLAVNLASSGILRGTRSCVYGYCVARESLVAGRMVSADTHSA